MYAKEIEDIITKAIRNGYVTVNDTDGIKRAAVETGEDFGEVMSVVRMRLNKMRPSRTNVMAELENSLVENLEIQRNQPGRLVGTFTDPNAELCMDVFGNMPLFPEYEELGGMPFTPDQATGLWLKIGNCELDLFDGSAPLQGTLNDTPRLQLRLVFWRHENLYRRFKALPCADLFKEVVHKTTDGDALCQYFIDCGGDTLAMTSIFALVLDKVYGVEIADLPPYSISTAAFKTQGADSHIDTKAGLQAELRRYGLPAYDTAIVNTKLLLRINAVEETAKLAGVCNKKYSETSRIRLIVDKDDRLLVRIGFNYGKASKNKVSMFFSAFKRSVAKVKRQDIEREISGINTVKWEGVSYMDGTYQEGKGK